MYVIYCFFIIRTCFVWNEHHKMQTIPSTLCRREVLGGHDCLLADQPPTAELRDRLIVCENQEVTRTGAACMCLLITHPQNDNWDIYTHPPPKKKKKSSTMLNFSIILLRIQNKKSQSIYTECEYFLALCQMIGNWIIFYFYLFFWFSTPNLIKSMKYVLSVKWLEKIHSTLMNGRY